jgi:hemoglobin
MAENLQATPYDVIGGQAAVDRIIDTFYDRMETLPEARGIRALHPQDLAATRAVLKKYLAQWLGGPQAYSAERGHPMLRARHLHVGIGIAERDAWMLCMRHALEDVVADAAARDWLLEKLAPVADWMRNRPEAT